MKRIGIYGGSFNPPHVGHLRAARYALEAFALDRLLLIPSCVTPNKPVADRTPADQHRLEMLRLAVGDEEKIQVCDLELRRGGISYTCQTLQQLRQHYPEDEFYLFIGTDMLLSFDSWKQPESILQEATLVVFDRDGKRGAETREKIQQLRSMGGRVIPAENPVTEISSTDLRRMLVFQCADPFLMPAVKAYIGEKGLYGTANSLRGLPMEALERTVISLLKPDRVRHVLGCRDTAAELAERWGADVTDAARAGLLHDITKALDGPLQLTLCSQYGIMLNAFSTQNPKTLHALTGSLVAQRIFGESEAVVAAIRSHTTGKADMNTLEKIIYVADYMEPNRDFDGVEQLRHLAYTDLDAALKMGLEMTLAVLKAQGREISPESAQALQWLRNV